MSEYENPKSPLGWESDPHSYGPVPRKIGIARDKPTVNYSRG